MKLRINKLPVDYNWVSPNMDYLSDWVVLAEDVKIYLSRLYYEIDGWYLESENFTPVPPSTPLNRTKPCPTCGQLTTVLILKESLN